MEAQPPAAAMAADIGVTGLGVMGRNLARNFARHGYVVAVHNRTYARTAALLAEYGTEGQFVGSQSMADFVQSLRRPRKVVIMVNAGAATDAVIDELLPLLDPDDIIIDAGNAHFADTRRREAALRGRGLHFVGTGVSGGEEGALNGPSIMPGGSTQAYHDVGPMLETIAAHVDGQPCCVHVGPDGAGHFVKMVHNGIEYADMQVISEAYDLLRRGLGLPASEIGDVFAEWNRGELQSYLIEITADILGHRDLSGAPFVDVVVDEAAQKGTGAWTVQTALDLGVPVTGIAEAAFARSVSAGSGQRAAIRNLVGSQTPLAVGDKKAFIEDVRQALFAAKIVAYAQGFDEIAEASSTYDWAINRGAMATIWRGGCIIRAAFLDRIREAFDVDPDLPSLLVAPYFADAIAAALPSWRRVVAAATTSGIPVPVFGSSLSYFDALRSDRLPAALIQAQRDYFGAHTYRRVDRPGIFHTLWAGDRSEVDAS